MKNKLVLLTIFFITALSLLVITPSTVEARKSYSTSYRDYSQGGSLYIQKGYLRRNGSYVQFHLKTYPDTTIYNNRKYILGY